MSMILISSLHESPTNPRKEVDASAQAELVESIRQHGIIQPIVARKLGGGYEIVCGSRRVRAAATAGLKEVPGTVRVLTDDEARVLQIEENVQRVDLSPLDEAESYHELMKLGKSADEIATTCHKSKAVIYGRLQLLRLPKIAVAALRKGAIQVGTAVLIGRIHDQKQREEAAKEIIGDKWHSPMGFSRAQEMIRRKYMLDLASAPFPPASPDLLPDAGACTSCPHRTGNNATLFGDVCGEKKGGDVCTNPPCFGAKKEAHVKSTMDAARAEGLRVLTAKESKAVFPHGNWISASSPFVEQGDSCGLDPKRRTWRALLGKDAPKAVVAVDGDGAARRLYQRSEAVAALRVKHAWAKEKSTSSTKMSARGGREAKAQRERAAVSARAIEYMVAAAEADASETPTIEMWRVIAAAAIRRACSDTTEAVCTRRGLRGDDKKKPGVRRQPSEDLLVRHLTGLDAPELRGLAMEVILAPALRGFIAEGPHGKALAADIDAAFGIPRAALVKEIRDAAAEKKPAPAKKAPGKKTAKKAGRRGGR